MHTDSQLIPVIKHAALVTCAQPKGSPGISWGAQLTRASAFLACSRAEGSKAVHGFEWGHRALHRPSENSACEPIKNDGNRLEQTAENVTLGEDQQRLIAPLGTWDCLCRSNSSLEQGVTLRSPLLEPMENA